MPYIETREKKTLKLTNVLSRKIPYKEAFSQDKQLMMMTNWIKAKGYKTMGPLIIYSKGMVGVDSDGAPIVDISMMIQLKESNITTEAPYSFQNQICIPNCLFARFNDDGEKIQFATNKLTLYAYENDLELTGESYTIVLEQNEKRMLADIFMPVKAK